MKAMLLSRLGPLHRQPAPLTLTELPQPQPQRGEILIRIHACGVCHTELDEIEGRTPPPRLPVIPGHQVVGTVAAVGAAAERYDIGQRVGVAWIGAACGHCPWCASGQENLCPQFRATGRDMPGGYAEYMTVHQDFAHPIPALFSDLEAAPLLCAGAVGYRALRLTGLRNGAILGLTGFGASAHLVLQMVRHRFPDTQVQVYARNPEERQFALSLGAAWAGDTTDPAPARPNAIIDTTPAWLPVVAALEALAPGGRLVINAIRKEDQDRDSLLGLDYERHLWQEKEIKTVANVTRRDVAEFLALAAEMRLRPAVRAFALEEANAALRELRNHGVRGAKVLHIAGR